MELSADAGSCCPDGRHARKNRSLNSYGDTGLKTSKLGQFEVVNKLCVVCSPKVTQGNVLVFWQEAASVQKSGRGKQAATITR